MSSLKKTEIYKIIVECRDSRWSGLFDFKPDSEDVATAIQQDIDELDENVEHESCQAQGLRKTLELVIYQTPELVTYQTPELLGKVIVAGTYVGEVLIEIIKIFTEEKLSLPVCTPASEETWKKALYKSVEDSDKAISTCRRSVCVK